MIKSPNIITFGLYWKLINGGMIMANITAKDVAELRKQTGVGMMDCKKALVEADGDFEKATVILREKGLATQAKKSGRVAAEGIVMAATNDAHTVGAVVEVNIETDFAANNDDFKKFVTDVAQTIIEKNPADIDALNAEQIQEEMLLLRKRFRSYS